MASTTTNYSLTKPATTDYYNISVPNANMDIIDSQMKTDHDLAAGAATLYSFTSTLTTTWSGTGPYTQAVTVSGILSTDKPIVGPVYDSDLTIRTMQKEAWNMISKSDTTANTITFICDEDKPTAAIPIQIQVVR